MNDILVFMRLKSDCFKKRRFEGMTQQRQHAARYCVGVIGVIIGCFLLYIRKRQDVNYWKVFNVDIWKSCHTLNFDVAGSSIFSPSAQTREVVAFWYPALLLGRTRAALNSFKVSFPEAVELVRAHGKEMDSPISDSLPHSSTGITHGVTHGNDASAMVLESALEDATSLKKSDDFPSKRYLIFDQSCRGSRRIFLHPHDEILRSTLGFRCSNFEAGDDRSRDPNSEPFRFHGTVALGIAALEYARSARASCSPLLPLLGPFRTIADDGPHSAQETESDEPKASGSDVNALLTSEDDEDEVTSSVTLPDGADERGYHAVDLDTDLWNEGRRKRLRCAEKMNDGEKLITSTAHRQSERESIKEKLKILSTIVGGGCMNTAALLGEVIHLVKNLQCQTANLP